MKIEPSIISNKHLEIPLVNNNGTRYIPLFRVQDINRDNFFRLRTQLMKLGCPKEDVLPVAKKLCMEILQEKSEKEYLKYILNDTFLKCINNINSGYNPYPIQDIHDLNYSHINLFSSIYGFEIEYLKSKRVLSDVADIGCGEGIFARLAKGNGIEVENYEIQKPTYSDIKINLIEGFYDIKKSYRCIVYNHVLEHISMRPDHYLSLVIDHFEKITTGHKLKSIIVSLPLHMHLASHQACKHQWVCTNDYINKAKERQILQNDLKIFYPTISFSALAKRLDFRLIVKNQMGIYVFER